jgi:hypothetical protein
MGRGQNTPMLAVEPCTAGAGTSGVPRRRFAPTGMTTGPLRAKRARRSGLHGLGERVVPPQEPEPR